MRLALNLGYWGLTSDGDNVAIILEAERLGYTSVWTAEAYGNDAATVLAWLAAKTTKIELGSGIFQIPGRSPAMAAMTAATIDTLSGGRFRLGLGVSGPQVSEGWHGVRFDKPVARTREYIDIVRLALARERVQYDGEHYVLPLPDGPGKALKMIIHPIREYLPIYLAAIGPKNLELAGEKCDGWLAIFYDPEFAPELLASVTAGKERAGRADAPFDVMPTTPVIIGDSVEECAEPIRGYAALYIGGMGSREQNFYNRLACRMGFEKEAGEIQDLYLDKKYAEAAAAVPLDFIDRTSLIGPVDRIAERMQALAASGVTTVNVSSYGGTLDERLATLRSLADALDKSGVGD
ncbi:MAG TPA: LLM class F420-dependent oxidoreductase [Mycobacteriales bacterium]|nr:LLM class F420-dependent oxidoreductase [Mycobacteriales bacterium]